ncbi:uncharacterized protein MONBRDRAFT_23205 [Monosiga brevicollis MX1]|uniref:Mic1 domain-containing protein n=1 Tax=Monosiga brevicollis TaxID=81824 RepID=A9URH3_MONBE|nr:uncharacterized protein MONBRDRAFT_23205 [Monosiga brevicollis MX1]EDQ91923.1 predicted protein [Monosiga brevicollis MX1]|eukprot:XP_001743209.1 hypothetical protein [Monosiga brevicollis MX1]
MRASLISLPLAAGFLVWCSRAAQVDHLATAATMKNVGQMFVQLRAEDQDSSGPGSHGMKDHPDLAHSPRLPLDANSRLTAWAPDRSSFRLRIDAEQVAGDAPVIRTITAQYGQILFLHVVRSFDAIITIEARPGESNLVLLYRIDGSHSVLPVPAVANHVSSCEATGRVAVVSDDGLVFLDLPESHLQRVQADPLSDWPLPCTEHLVTRLEQDAPRETALRQLLHMALEHGEAFNTVSITARQHLSATEAMQRVANQGATPIPASSPKHCTLVIPSLRHAWIFSADANGCQLLAKSTYPLPDPAVAIWCSGPRVRIPRTCAMFGKMIFVICHGNNTVLYTYSNQRQAPDILTPEAPLALHLDGTELHPDQLAESIWLGSDSLALQPLRMTATAERLTISAFTESGECRLSTFIITPVLTLIQELHDFAQQLPRAHPNVLQWQTNCRLLFQYLDDASSGSVMRRAALLTMQSNVQLSELQALVPGDKFNGDSHQAALGHLLSALTALQTTHISSATLDALKALVQHLDVGNMTVIHRLTSVSQFPLRRFWRHLRLRYLPRGKN